MDRQEVVIIRYDICRKPYPHDKQSIPPHIHMWHAHITRFTAPRMSTRHRCEANMWRHEAHFAAVVRGWCSCYRCRFRPPKLSLLSRAPDCPCPRCCCCCRPAAV